MQRFAVGHSAFMKEALCEARAALEKGEVPVGAIVVLEGEVVGRGHNLRESYKDPTAHAEMLAIRQAAERLGRWRLEGAVLYVTLEPCAMCAGAIVAARIKTCVYGARDSKAGAAGTVLDVLGLRAPKSLNHSVEVIGGVCEQECGLVLKEFFAGRRDI